MRQSNLYIIIFSVVLTIVVGGLLSFTSEALKPLQKKAEELDTKKKILSSVMQVDDKTDVLGIYEKNIQSVIVDINGNEVQKTDVTAEDINIAKEYKKPAAERVYPVFKYSASGQDKVEAYILPVYGNGLWDNIWGYVALKADVNTIKGVVFDHKGETPGLGARITEANVQERFEGKEIYNESGELVSVKMLKGESNPDELLDAHHVDGMSGATITGRGVNRMLQNYFENYQNYFKKVK